MSELPTEILLMIFKLIPGIDLYRCRRVCRRWMNTIENMNEREWKRFCIRDHRFIHKAYERAKLTYKELHKSMFLWPKLEDAKVMLTQIYGKSFKLLSNGVLAVCLIDNLSCRRCLPTDECVEHCDRANTVVYYDVNTMKEIRRKTYHVLFRPDKYEENEKLVLLRGYERNEVIEVKNKCIIVIDNRDIRDGINFYLNDTKIMVTGRSTLTVLTVEETRYNTRFYSLDRLWGDIVSVNCFKNNLYVLSGTYYTYGQIHCLHKGQFVNVATLDRFRPHIFERFGFDWTRPDIYEWLTHAYKEQLEMVTKYMIHSACRFGTTTLFVTRLHGGKFFLSLSKFRKPRLHFNKSIPIDFGSKFPSLEETHIENIDAVEIVDGHIVFLLLADRRTIVAFEYCHAVTSSQWMALLEPSTSETGTKRPKNRSPIKPGPSTSGLKLKKAKDKTDTESSQSTTGLDHTMTEDQPLSDQESSTSGFQIAIDQTMAEQTESTEHHPQTEPEQSSELQNEKYQIMMDLDQCTSETECLSENTEKSNNSFKTVMIEEHSTIETGPLKLQIFKYHTKAPSSTELKTQVPENETEQSSSGLKTEIPKEQSPIETELSTPGLQSVKDQSDLETVPSITGLDLNWPKDQPQTTPGQSNSETEDISETLI